MIVLFMVYVCVNMMNKSIESSYDLFRLFTLSVSPWFSIRSKGLLLFIVIVLNLLLSVCMLTFNTTYNFLKILKLY